MRPRIRILRHVLERPVVPRKPFLTDLGRVAVFLLTVQAVTGILLALYYRPDPEGAFESVKLLTNSVTLGWLVRSIHLMAAHALVAVALLYLARGFFRRKFLKPVGRQAWILSWFLLALAMAFFATGEALVWDQDAYWRMVVTANVAEELPLVGESLARFLRGGDVVNGATLVRAYALHGLVFPWLAFAGLLRARRIRRRGGLR